MAALSWRHWYDDELAMRRGEPLAPSVVPRLMALTLALAAVGAAVALVLLVLDAVPTGA